MTQHARATIRGRAGPWNRIQTATSRTNVDWRQSAFTLVELLVVMVIIGMLAGITLGALASARETNRAAKTRTTIAKVDKVIMAKYDSYRTRRVPLGRTEINTIANFLYNISGGLAYGQPMRATAITRVNVLRDLMRMEMPDRWNDIVEGDAACSLRNPLIYNAANFATHNAANFATQPPTLARRYWASYQWAKKTSGASRETLEKWGPAECLYQIVMASPGARGQFHESEIGDIDGDGLKEFHDGWGKPIMFIRWPAGFVPELGANSEFQNLSNPDPFDPYKIHRDDPTTGRPAAWALYPLIFSAGPDGMYDVSAGRSTGSGNATGDPYYRYTLSTQNNTLNEVWPYVKDGDGNYVGLPMDADPVDGVDNWKDNIHNHRHEVK